MFPFPTQSVTVDRSRYAEWVRAVPDMWYCVAPLPDDAFRITFKAGEVPSHFIE